MRARKKVEEYKRSDLKKYLELSAEEKLNYLEKVNAFLNAFMPAKSKRIWKRLKKSNW